MPLWPSRVERVPLGSDRDASFALHLPAATPSGAPPVVLVHGYRGCALEWGPLAERLARTRDVWAVELMAGTSDEEAGLREVHALLDDVRGVARDTGPVDVVASSMGGFVAVSWAAARRGVVDRMAVLAPALVPLQRVWAVPGLTRLIATQRALDTDERRWRSGLGLASIDEFFAADTPQHLTIAPPWRQAVLDHHRTAVSEPSAVRRTHARQAVVRALMTALRERGAVQRMLEQIERPVLWLHGDADPKVPIASSRRVAAALPACTFVTLRGVGHLPHLECPNLVVRHVDQWAQAKGSEGVRPR